MSKSPCKTQTSFRMIHVILWLLISAATGCNSKVTPPPKPSSVPANAVWAGGPDGGSFIECDVDAEHNVNRCLAYNEFTGDVTGEAFSNCRGPLALPVWTNCVSMRSTVKESIWKKACSSQHNPSVRLRSLEIQSLLVACLSPALMQDHL